MLVPNLGFIAEVAVFVALALVPMWWAIIDVAKRSQADLSRLALPRYVWVLVILFAGPIGGAGYLTYARLRLRKPGGAAA